MVKKKNIVDELKGFYYQNVISNMYIATTLLGAIILDVIDKNFYLLIVASTIMPHLYEFLFSKIKTKIPNFYYYLGLYLNSIIFSVFIYSVSFEPTLTGLLILMYTYTLISYGGWSLWFYLFPILVVKVALLYFIFGTSEVLYAPIQIVISSIITSCCFIIVTASYRFDSKNELIRSRIELKSLLKKQSSLSKNLSRYLSPKLVETLVNGDNSIENHQRKEVVIFFSDLCNFTSLSEEMSPEDMSMVLNQYLSRMSEIANKYGATIDKFIGDSVMVFFGAPNSISPKEDALRCIRMANEMQKEMSIMNGDWHSNGIQHQFKARIGVHQGWATVGNFGAENQVNYTVIGTTVNIASRLEQQCPPDGILVSRKIMELCKEEFQFDYFDSLSLKGIDNKVDGYTLNSKHMYGSKKINLVIQVNENTIEDTRWKLKKQGITAYREY
jgi:class 3 adenylate cyclase